MRELSFLETNLEQAVQEELASVHQEEQSPPSVCGTSSRELTLLAQGGTLAGTPFVPGQAGGWYTGKRLAHPKKGFWELVPEISCYWDFHIHAPENMILLHI